MSRSIQLYNICEKGGKITFYLIFLGIASLLYLPDMVDKYQKKATTFTTVTEQVKNEKVDPPTITICMDMPLKPSYVESTLKDAEYFWRMKRGSMTRGKNTNELFENATYQYNQDFVLRYGEDVTVKLWLGKHSYNVSGVIEEIEVTPYNTIHYGKCYAITTTQYETRKWRLLFKEELQIDDLPRGIRLFITSKNASKNVIWAKWPAVEPLVVQLNRIESVSTRIILKQTEWNFHEGNENCLNGCAPEDCFSSAEFKGLNQAKKNGSDDLIFTSCIPVPLKHFFKVFENFTHCDFIYQSGKNSERMMQLFGQVYGEKALHCQKPKYQMQYHADILESYYKSTDDRIIFFVQHDYKIQTVKEETLIYDTLTLVGTLGGFLGLFIGFSFFGLFAGIFVYCLKMGINHN